MLEQLVVTGCEQLRAVQVPTRWMPNGLQINSSIGHQYMTAAWAGTACLVSSLLEVSSVPPECQGTGTNDTPAAWVLQQADVLHKSHQASISHQAG